MVKIRLIEKGFEKYTGPIAQYQFENGVSVAELSDLDAMRIGASMKCEKVDSSTQLSPSQVLLDSKDSQASTVRATSKIDRSLAGSPLAKTIDEGPVVDRGPAVDEESPPTKAVDIDNPGRYEVVTDEAKSAVMIEEINRGKLNFDYTRESLEAIADAQGMPGLRKVAAQYGVRGVSIKAVVDAMMALKTGKEKPTS